MDEKFARSMGYMKVYDSAVKSLANLEIPDLMDDFSEEKIFEAFCYLASGEPETTTIDPENMAYLTDRIEKESQGKIKVVPAEFYTGIKGQNTQYYMKDSEGNVLKKLVFSMGLPNFEFY